MATPSKLTPNITQLIGNNVAFGLHYALAAASAELLIKPFGSKATALRISTEPIIEPLEIFTKRTCKKFMKAQS